MRPSTAVVLGMGTIFAIALVRSFGAGGKWLTARQVLGLFASGLILMLLGRASAPLAKGLVLIMVLAYVLTVGIPGIALLSKSSSKTATTVTAKVAAK